MNFSLELIAFIGIILGALISVLVPICWQYNRHLFQCKLKVIDEFLYVNTLHRQARQFINRKIHNKYAEFNRKGITDNGLCGIELSPRKTALVGSLEKYYEEYSDKNNSAEGLTLVYSTLFGRDIGIFELLIEIEKIQHEIVTAHYEICHTEKSCIEVFDIMKIIQSKTTELKNNKSKMLDIYIDSFSFWYRLKNFVRHLKSNK